MGRSADAEEMVKLHSAGQPPLVFNCSTVNSPSSRGEDRSNNDPCSSTTTTTTTTTTTSATTTIINSTAISTAVLRPYPRHHRVTMTVLMVVAVPIPQISALYEIPSRVLCQKQK